MAGPGSLFYLHGAGNRDVDAAAYEDALRAGLGLSPTSKKLVRSHWGEQCGTDATLPRLDDILPEVIPGGAGFEVVPDVEDPMAPLRALAAPPGQAAFVAPTADADQLLALLEAGIVDLSDIGIAADSVQQAANTVATSPEYAAAAGPVVDVVDATLQSVSAVAVANEGAAAFGPGDVVAAIAKASGAIAERVLGSSAMSVLGTWAGANLLPGLKLALSRRLAQDRAAILRKGVLVPTDILVYQRNGAVIRDFVRSEIAALEPPVVAIGHSLGGIILVDALFEPGQAQNTVELVITFGSQSAYLQSVGGLGELSPNLPWINIWTRYDFVSFLAEKMWPGKVTDIEIPIEVGFPDSHGAYYVSEAFFDTVRAQPAVKAILG
jgi:hypothetical protein